MYTNVCTNIPLIVSNKTQSSLVAPTSTKMAIKLNQIIPDPILSKKGKQDGDCIVCTLSPFLSFACLIGANGVTYSCPHRSSTAGTAKFQVSKPKVLLTSCCIALSLCMFFFNLYDYVNESNRVLAMVTLSEAVFCISDVIAKIFSSANSDLRAEVLTFYQTIVDNRLFYGLETMLKPSEIRTTRKRQTFSICLTCCILSMHITIYLMVKPLGHPMSYAKILNEVLISYGQTTGIIQLNTELRLFEILFDKCYNKVKKTLRDHYEAKRQEESGEEYRSTPVMFSSIPDVTDIFIPKQKMVEMTLKKCRELHTIIITGVRSLNRCFKSIFIIWVLLIITQLIINFYVLIKSYGEFGTIDPGILLCLIRIGLNTPIAITVQFEAEFLATKVRRFLNVSTYVWKCMKRRQNYEYYPKDYLHFVCLFNAQLDKC